MAKSFIVTIDGRPGGKIYRDASGRLVWFKEGRGKDTLPPRINVKDAQAIIKTLARSSHVTLIERKTDVEHRR